MLTKTLNTLIILQIVNLVQNTYLYSIIYIYFLHKILF